MARKTGEAKYKKAAEKVVKQYKVWVKKGCVNLVGLLRLLEAEHLALTPKKRKQAFGLFEDAISVLTGGGFYQHVALACERYSSLLGEMGDETVSACTLFGAWNMDA